MRRFLDDGAESGIVAWSRARFYCSDRQTIASRFGTSGGLPFLDYKSDGFAEQSGRVSPGEGLLCMDLNGNGIIHNRSELFGNQTLLQNGQMAVNGLQALAALDRNHGGMIDAQDLVSHLSWVV